MLVVALPHHVIVFKTFCFLFRFLLKEECLIMQGDYMCLNECVLYAFILFQICMLIFKLHLHVNMK